MTVLPFRPALNAGAVPADLSREQLDKHWRLYSACTDADPELFFIERGSPRQMIDDARAVCAACPVKAQCLAWAIQEGARDGIWGGLTPRERGAYARREGLTTAYQQRRQAKSA